MTNALVDTETQADVRKATKRTVLMCRPDYFTVSYRINPWMHPEDPTSTQHALDQWNVLYQTYLDLGFDRVYLHNGMWDTMVTTTGAVISGQSQPAAATAQMKQQFASLFTK